MLMLKVVVSLVLLHLDQLLSLAVSPAVYLDLHCTHYTPQADQLHPTPYTKRMKIRPLPTNTLAHTVVLGSAPYSSRKPRHLACLLVG